MGNRNHRKYNCTAWCRGFLLHPAKVTNLSTRCRGGTCDRVQDREARVLVDQVTRLLPLLKVEIASALSGSSDTDTLRALSDAYERLASASKRTDAVVWERTTVDGRTAADLMERLWKVRNDIRRLNQLEWAEKTG